MSSLVIPTLDSSSSRTTTLTINPAAAAAAAAASPSAVLATPLSPTAGDVRQLLSQIQFVAHRSSNLVHAIAVKEARFPTTKNSEGEKDGFAAPARSFSCLPETMPVGELDAIKSLLEDIWQATVPLTGAVYFLGSASLLLRNRLYSIVRDVARYLDVVAGELQAWLGGDEHNDDEKEPLTPVSMEDEDDYDNNETATKTLSSSPSSSTPAESIPPAHVSIVLDVMLALLEASSGMLAAMSRLRGAGSHGGKRAADESKEAASRCLDRARFQTHMYRPENEGLSAEYVDEDRLGFRVLEEHVASLTSYLWCDFGSGSVVASGW